MTASLDRLRELLAGESLHAYYVPSQDEHLNEFVPAWRQRRTAVSGFDGSAGDLLVGLDEAWLFVDSRYHIQADRQLAGTGVTPVKLGADGAKSFLALLAGLAEETAPFRLGCYPYTLSLASGDAIERILTPRQGSLVATEDLVSRIWNERPAPPTSELVTHDVRWAGQSLEEKLARLREDLAERNADATLVTKLDQIAWLLNLRSRDDVDYNPVFESYLAVSATEAHLFLHGGKRRLPAPLAGVEVHDYAEFPGFLSAWTPSTDHEGKLRLSLDAAGATRGGVAALPADRWTIRRGASPIEARKAVKNEAEQHAARDANLRASVAKTRALLWLRQRIDAGDPVTERSFATHLEELYAAEDGYFGLSFGTISSTGPNGAIIHYADCGEVPLESDHLFLIDSGAHIAGGSTDDTRTVAVGPPSDEARRLYTLVLKGHVRCATQRIPAGTPGAVLDALARGPLWNVGLDYGHGTGHGIGAFLNVHEGPFGLSHQVRLPAAQYPLQPGMITSVEPGYYREGWGGIRIENLYLIREWEAQPGYLELECLTWIPFDATLIDPALLEESETRWIDAYQAECLERLTPHLDAEEVSRLRDLLG